MSNIVVRPDDSIRTGVTPLHCIALLGAANLPKKNDQGSISNPQPKDFRTLIVEHCLLNIFYVRAPGNRFTVIKLYNKARCIYNRNP